MAITYLSANNIQGLAADTKPTNVPANSRFYETDTYRTYYYVSGSWIQLNNIEDYSFLVYLDSGVCKAKQSSNGTVVSSNVAADVVINDVITNIMSASGGSIFFKGDSFTFVNPIVLPVSSSAVSNSYVFKGVPTNARNIGGTTFKTDSTFPTNRYFIECVSTPGTGKGTALTVDGIQFWNQFPDLATAGGTQINVGGIKYECDIATAGLLNLSNIQGHYMWRGLHIIGIIYTGFIENILMSLSWNENFIGNCDYILEKTDRDQVGGTDHGDRPTGMYLRNLASWHSSGLYNDTPTPYGNTTNVLYMNCKYSKIDNLTINGSKCTDSIIRINQGFSNVIDNVYMMDHNFKHASSLAVMVIDSDGGEAMNNKLYNMKMSGTGVYPYTYKFLNGALRNEIHAQYFGAVPTVDDAGAGIDNILFMYEGHQPSATASARVTQTGTALKIVDFRSRASKKGIKTSSGDASTKVFTQAHGCFTTPLNWYVYPLTADAMGAFDVTVDSTNITITYTFAPPNGSSNLKWSWFADVYAS